MKSNTATHAELELDILGQTVSDSIVYPFKDEILALCDKFGKSGESGGSAPFVATALAQAIKKLCLQEPITPITGVDDEWMSVAEACGGNDIYQNRREGAIFKEGKDGKAYYLDAIVFKDQRGSTFTSNHGVWMNDESERIYSRQYIKAFPFTPKTFYIDVILAEVAKDWDSKIKDDKQLAKAFKYYDKK
jgi:hypothetical protein